jgi:trehalose 6-phosphate synthase
VGLDAYGEIGKALDSVSGRINGRFATVDWAPIRYLYRSCGRDHIAGLYRAARVGLVTPLRDGMNLVAKEYVAAQDPADPGVLILSRFAGAAAQMKEALIVNPYSREDVADAIHLALVMPKVERIARWTALMAGVERDDADGWRDSFLHALRPQTATLRRRQAA